MIATDAVAALRPRPSGPPLRGRAPLRNGIMEGRLVGRQNTKQGTAGSTLNSPISGRTLGVGAFTYTTGTNYILTTGSKSGGKRKAQPA